MQSHRAGRGAHPAGVLTCQETPGPSPASVSLPGKGRTWDRSSLSSPSLPTATPPPVTPEPRNVPQASAPLLDLSPGTPESSWQGGGRSPPSPSALLARAAKHMQMWGCLPQSGGSGAEWGLAALGLSSFTGVQFPRNYTSSRRASAKDHCSHRSRLAGRRRGLRHWHREAERPRLCTRSIPKTPAPGLLAALASCLSPPWSPSYYSDTATCHLCQLRPCHPVTPALAPT